jgi:hypothetical protein
VTWIVALVGGLLIQAPVTSALAPLVPLPQPAVRALVFVVAVLALEGVFALVGRAAIVPLVRAVRRTPALGVVDHLLGVLPAVARALIVIAIALGALLLLPVGSEVRSAIDGSRIARILIAEVQTVQPLLGRLVTESDGAPLFVTRLGAEDRQALDLPDDLELVPDPEAERQLVALVNQERSARGLPTLALDERLVPVARAHGEDMFRAKYFGHRSPTTGTHADRLAAAGIGFERAGENLAYAHTIAAAHRGLMESPGHRENILHAEFTHVGIGVVSAGPYGRMITQLFLRP